MQTFSRSRNAAFLDKFALRLARGEWAKLLASARGGLRTVHARISSEMSRAAPAATLATPESGAAPPSKKQKKSSAVPALTASGEETATLSAELRDEWEQLSVETSRLQRQLDKPQDGGMAFAFVEGSLVRALREGHWMLLDEVNLAAPETLERVAAVLEDGGSVSLTERGDADAVPRHPDFRLFAAMNVSALELASGRATTVPLARVCRALSAHANNCTVPYTHVPSHARQPPTDFGKKDLPPGIRSRFTELYIEPLSSTEDIQLLVLQQLTHVLPHPPVAAIVSFFQAAVQEAERSLLDGANQRPQYSLRSLCRALSYASTALSGYGLERALWDGFHMTFVTQLQQRFQPAVETLMLRLLIPAKKGGDLRKPPPSTAPPRPTGGDWVQFGGFWVAADPRNPVRTDERYIVTPTIEMRLRQVARMTAARRFPVLLQGPTSAGKTSMVERLAHATGHRLVRINNHEHTDVQEYIGSFQPDGSGRLHFCDGALAQAVRHGYWIVLDELNLAPSEVLEALNRLLDDNRELLIPETNETIRPHEHFMLFATQNPPGSYGGRKVLSRAFRNRFVELQMDEIPSDELRTILEKRCALPASFCARMVDVMLELQRRRSSSRVFQGKDGFITPRDLFRWADRKPSTYQELAEAGFMLLGERLRQDSEQTVVKEVLQKLLPRTQLDTAAVYHRIQQETQGDISRAGGSPAVWISSTVRLYSLVAKCMQHDEPVLLVGETGTGKTTVCQLYAEAIGQTLHMINCHQHTETSDFIGGLRPARGRAFQLQALQQRVAAFELDAATALTAVATPEEVGADVEMPTVGVPSFAGDARLATPAPASLTPHEEEERAEPSVEELLARVERACGQLTAAGSAGGLAAAEGEGGAVEADGTPTARFPALMQEAGELQAMGERCNSLFVWQDGPLLTAMRQGELLLIDEISLADDAVLERLNSVLDPARLLVLPEKGNELEEVPQPSPHESSPLQSTQAQPTTQSNPPPHPRPSPLLTRCAPL